MREVKVDTSKADFGRGTISFEVEGKITKEEQSKLQQEAGYHPMGYGIYAMEFKDGKTTWRCSANCD